MTRRVISQPQTYQAMQRGINQIVEAVRPTLGPRSRHALVDTPGKPPEFIDNGGIIARRIIALADPDEDMGAMLIRTVLWRMHDEVGDGTATTAMLFKTIFDEGVRYITAGGNAMLLRRHLLAGLELILDELQAQTQALDGQAQLTHLAASLCHDPQLAEAIAEVFASVGEQGRIEIRKGHGRESFKEYVEGTYWDGGLWATKTPDGCDQSRVDVTNAALLISDLTIEEPQQLLPVLHLATSNNIAQLIVVVRQLSDKALGLLHYNNDRTPDVNILAVKAPGSAGADRESKKAALDDLAILTGGRVFIEAAGDTFEPVTMDDLGYARRVWAERALFGIVRGKGNTRKIRRHLHDLQTIYAQQQDTENKRKTLERIGCLLGGSATLWVGGVSERDIEIRKERVISTINAMRYAVQAGVLPGGGVALLNCQHRLQEKAAANTLDTDERAAYHILCGALEAPIRALLTNAGYDASEILAHIRSKGTHYGCDVTTGAITTMQEAGIYDIAGVLREAVWRAVSSAALALTTDILIHVPHPEEVMTPR